MSENEDTINGLEIVETKLNNSPAKVDKISYPITKTKKNFPPCWNSKLSLLRKRMLKKINSTRSTETIESYVIKSLADALTGSWRDYCGSIEKLETLPDLVRYYLRDI